MILIIFLFSNVGLPTKLVSWLSLRFLVYFHFLFSFPSNLISTNNFCSIFQFSAHIYLRAMCTLHKQKTFHAVWEYTHTYTFIGSGKLRQKVSWINHGMTLNSRIYSISYTYKCMCGTGILLSFIRLVYCCTVCVSLFICWCWNYMHF